MEQKVFKQILKCIPETDKNKKYIMDAALNIYLTWCGIRPACVPFDGPYSLKPHITKIINSLNKIDGICAKEGPYYDSGIHILVYNTSPQHKTNVELLIHKVESLRSKIDMLRSQLKASGADFADIHNDKNVKILLGKLNPIIGKLLGYQCPLNLSDPLFYSNDVYQIAFQIKEIQFKFGFWCPTTDKKDKVMAKCLTKLEEIKRAFDKLNMRTLNELELNIRIVEH